MNLFAYILYIIMHAIQATKHNYCMYVYACWLMQGNIYAKILINIKAVYDIICSAYHDDHFPRWKSMRGVGMIQISTSPHIMLCENTQCPIQQYSFYLIEKIIISFHKTKLKEVHVNALTIFFHIILCCRCSRYSNLLYFNLVQFKQGRSQVVVWCLFQ